MVPGPLLASLAVLCLGTVAAACGGSGGTLAQQVRTWASGASWSSTTNELTGDLERLSDLGSDNAGARRTACDVLVTDALNANQQLPTPDSTLTSLLSEAYTDAADAGRDCFAGGSRLASATTQQEAAQRNLVRAQARYDDLTSSLTGG